LIIIPPVL